MRGQTVHLCLLRQPDQGRQSHTYRSRWHQSWQHWNMTRIFFSSSGTPLRIGIGTNATESANRVDRQGGTLAPSRHIRHTRSCRQDSVAAQSYEDQSYVSRGFAITRGILEPMYECEAANEAVMTALSLSLALTLARTEESSRQRFLDDLQANLASMNVPSEDDRCRLEELHRALTVFVDQAVRFQSS